MLAPLEEGKADGTSVGGRRDGWTLLTPPKFSASQIISPRSIGSLAAVTFSPGYALRKTGETASEGVFVFNRRDGEAAEAKGLHPIASAISSLVVLANHRFFGVDASSHCPCAAGTDTAGATALASDAATISALTLCDNRRLFGLATSSH